MNKPSPKKWQSWIILAILIVTVIGDYYIIRRASLPAQASSVQLSQLPVYNKQELAKYDGSNAELPIYLAMDGYVYDVSLGRADFYGPSQPYNDLAGRDSSQLLHLAGGSIIKEKYQVVGRYQE